MAEVGSAFVSILPSAKGFGKKLEGQVGPETKKTGSKLGSGLGKAFAIAGGAAAAVGFVKGSIAQAREAQKVGALTAAVIKSTGGAANVTAGQVGNLANAISRKTGIDDETIQSGENMLLTFKNIRNEAGKGNDIFNQTSKTLVDMSAALGKDPKTAAIALGKALNDPIKGVTALSRVGVTFSEKQKGVIKSLVETGHTADAQKLILKELNSEFGGAAAAQATAGDKAKVAFENLQETVGTALLPVLDRLSNWFTTKIAPAITTFVTNFSKGEGAAGRFRTALEKIGAVATSVAGFISRNKTAVATFLGVLIAARGAMIAYNIVTGIMAGIQAVQAVAAGSATTAQIALNAAMRANVIGIIITLIAAVAAGLIYAYKHSETFRNIVNGAFHAVVAAGKFMWNALVGFFQIIINVWLTLVGAIIHGAAKAFGWIPGIGGKLKKLAGQFDNLKDNINRSLDKIKNKDVKVSADTKNMRDGISEAKRLLDSLHDKDITVTTAFRYANKPKVLPPGFAKGTNFAPGGVALVGETGPELVYLPRGSKVTPNNELRARDLSPVAAGGGGGGTYALTITNWRDGTGYLSAVADGRVAAHAGVTREAARARR